ncbi:MAG TPA: rRNA maturation RNase YbeY [Dictyobacter sp.]|jgi:probable rRNA maturation factor|nr:rRNA maturation RNase YbeY [Dictyobacter sp.]
MQEHPLIELYLTHSDDKQNTLIEQSLAGVDLDRVVQLTLQTANITQPAMLTLMITDDEGIREMNKQYREKDKATDVLSFPLLERPIVDAPEDQLWEPQPTEEGAATPAEDTPPFITPPGMITNLGDIVISWPTIVRQAGEAGHNTLTELMYLLSHGVLHLIGYDDHSESGYQTMVNIQQSVLKAIGQELYKG